MSSPIDPPMIVSVTRAQVEAAKLLVERARETGSPIEWAVQLIADAKRPPMKTLSDVLSDEALHRALRWRP